MSDPLSGVITRLKSEQIIPDVLPADLTFTPSVLFSVAWPENGTEVVLGDKIKQSLTSTEPQLKITPTLAPKGTNEPADSAHGPEPRYTLVMTDPDAPSRVDPKFGEFRHWVLPGITIPPTNVADRGTDVFANKPKEALTAYYPPGPPPGTGFHRYVFLLFQEPTEGYTVAQDAIERESAKESRRSWKAMKFAEKYGLKLVGANFFLTEHEA